LQALIDCVLQIRGSAFHDELFTTVQGNDNSASLILASARAVLIGQTNLHATDRPGKPSKCKVQATMNVFGCGLFAVHLSGNNLNTHRISPLCCNFHSFR
jgi:hypothetical protein